MNDVIVWSGFSISLSIFCLAMVIMSIRGGIRQIADSLESIAALMARDAQSREDIK